MTGAPDYQAPVPMTANEAVLVRKTARDTGFDVPGEPDAVWLPVHSTHAPVRVWIARVNMNGYAIAMSMHSVAVTVALERPLVADPGHLPLGAVDTIVVTGGAELRATLRRIHQLSRSLPTHPLDEFRLQTAGLPMTTEAERLAVVRVGQEIFRDGLLAYWDGACAITGLAVPDLLRASHAKPWASCATDDERLDSHNGLLLAGHLDLAFRGTSQLRRTAWWRSATNWMHPPAPSSPSVRRDGSPGSSRPTGLTWHGIGNTCSGDDRIDDGIGERWTHRPDEGHSGGGDQHR